MPVPSWLRATLMLGIPMALVSMWGAGLFHHRVEPGLTPSTSAAEGVPVTVMTLASRTIDDALDLPGTVVAAHSALVGSRVLARVLSVRVQEGERVRAGTLLAELEARDLQAQLEAASSGREAATATLAQARARLAIARTTLTRIRALRADGGVTAQQVEEAEATFREATAAVAAASRQGDAAAAGADLAEAVRGHARIEAPFSGLVVEKIAQQGMLATPGQALFRVESGPFRLDVPVEERLLKALKVGQGVAVTLEGLEVRLSGRLQRLVPAVDPTTRTAIAQIGLPSDPRLASGMFGRARLGVGRSTRLALPTSAVVRWYQLTSAYVVGDDQVARLRLVRLGSPVGQGFEVLSGLSAGERVVVAPAPGLRDGQAVSVRP